MQVQGIYLNARSSARWPALALGLILALLPGLPQAGGEPPMAPASDLLLDDFRREDGLSARATRWRGFSDQVMGGVSEGMAGADTLDGLPCLRLRGRVSLENNGGFIQVALDLDPEGAPLDASDFAGIRLLVRGNGETGYHLHLRSTDTRLPWQYYDAPFETGAGWTEVKVPFAAFTPRGLERDLRADRLLRVAVVASKRAFEADVSVARISLYRDTV